MNRKIALILSLVISGPLLVQAENRSALNQDEATRARMEITKDQLDFHKMVDRASEVYSAIAKGPHGEVPASVLKKAQCIAVLPNVMTGALVVGGTHGSGLASCKDSSNNWSQPAPISFNQGSIGLQAGAKSADLVLFFQNNTAVQALKTGELAMGTDVSAVAGNYDSNIDTSNAQLVAYSRTEGLFAGASINGGKLGKDQSDLTSYYGSKANYTAILEGRESPDSSGYTTKLTKLFPQI